MGGMEWYWRDFMFFLNYIFDGIYIFIFVCVLIDKKKKKFVKDVE